MNDLVRLQDTFRHKPLTTLNIHGRDGWIARQVGEAIGYAQRGKRFATKITGDWANEFIQGRDYDLITGKELEAFKALFFKGTGSVPLTSPRGMLVLYESGLNLALVKTRKPLGVELRRFLADEVMPQLARTGSYTPEVTASEPVEELEGQRERRLQVQADTARRRVELMERQAKADAIRDTVRQLHELGQIDAATVAAYEVRAAELITGADLTPLRPAGPGNWLTPKQIGWKLGTTAYTIGRVITELGLREDVPGLARSYPYWLPHRDEPVRCFAYSPEAVRRIEAVLLARV